jgi:N-acyl-L-homoserine lactone synthetase
MIVVVEQHNAAQHADLVDQMFQLRARTFGERLGWDVKVVDGRERDKYDDLFPVYILDVEGGRVVGSLRLLPTTGPTLLDEVFADTGGGFVAPEIWECTRFCVGGAGRRQELISSGRLIAALGEVAIKAGIETVLGNFTDAMLRLYRRIGCAVDVVGVSHRFGDPVYLGLFPVSADILGTVKGRMR